jgi:hypothetical protein
MSVDPHINKLLDHVRAAVDLLEQILVSQSRLTGPTEWSVWNVSLARAGLLSVGFPGREKSISTLFR